jgi:ABC-type proline/glycine betaine transport system ATPase subunit
MRDEGRTIVFVTHDMSIMNRFCHRALLLEKGSVVHLGEPHEVADRYLEINFGRNPQADGSTAEERGGDGDARVVEAWTEDEHGDRQTSLPQGRQITLKALVRFAVQVEDPVASVYVLNEDHVAIIVATTSRENEHSGRFDADDEVLFSFTFANVLAPGRYNPLFTLAHRGTGLDLMDRFEGALSFVVTGPEAMGGLIDVPVEVSVAGHSTSPSWKVGA